MARIIIQLILFAVATTVVGTLFTAEGNTRGAGEYRCGSLSAALSSYNTVDDGVSVPDGSSGPDTTGRELTQIGEVYTPEYSYINDVLTTMNSRSNWDDIR